MITTPGWRHGVTENGISWEDANLKKHWIRDGLKDLPPAQ